MSSKSIITLLFRVMQMALDTLLIVADAVALLIPWTVRTGRIQYCPCGVKVKCHT